MALAIPQLCTWPRGRSIRAPHTAFGIMPSPHFSNMAACRTLEASATRIARVALVVATGQARGTVGAHLPGSPHWAQTS